MSSFAEAFAFGVLHRGTEAVATFSATRAAPGTKGLDEGVESTGATTTRAGNVTLAWHQAGEHVAVSWLDERTLVVIAAADQEAAVTSASAWLRATGTP